jgi:tryptophanyl-tRNA synthetase
MNNLPEIDKALAEGAEKASKIADGILKRVRQKLGFL